MAAPLTDAATNSLRDLIISGRLQPGQRLPAEAELSAQLGVSRGSLREAVRVLVAAGALDVRRGNGTFVTSLTPEVLLSGLGPAVEMMGDTSLVELIEARRLIEPVVTALAAEKVTEPQIHDMRLHLALMRQSQDVEELVRHDANFHYSIASSCGNSVLATILQGISTITTRTRVWRGMIDQDAREQTITEHAAIADAIASHDARTAEAAALMHVKSVETWIRETVARAESTRSAIEPAEMP
ncbi:FadR/GntR family transcriptional regulator [Leekyejoonella antrihumi]|uniref:FadR family transcriptional regulator n=1 Tax=Leekyejoonella antrihumi TaxID=1660198 RepID=A0A563DVH7_9MICO|nr:FadR/GntR family transcriptional regulator [Leekyejoonella antrihumi]TWP34129.1 FadR family transcriptional regulator [Leekyejoonella antrihumi]